MVHPDLVRATRKKWWRWRLRHYLNKSFSYCCLWQGIQYSRLQILTPKEANTCQTRHTYKVTRYDSQNIILKKNCYVFLWIFFPFIDWYTSKRNSSPIEVVETMFKSAKPIDKNDSKFKYSNSQWGLLLKEFEPQLGLN